MNSWIMDYVECCAFVLFQCLSQKARHPDNTTAFSTGYNHHSGSWYCASGNAGHRGSVGKKALEFVRLWRFVLNVLSHCCKLWHFSSLTLQWGTSERKRNRAWPQKNVRFTITYNNGWLRSYCNSLLNIAWPGLTIYMFGFVCFLTLTHVSTGEFIKRLWQLLAVIGMRCGHPVGDPLQL